jgi:hypothetical protein
MKEESTEGTQDTVYQWAFARGITTMPTFAEARLNDPITRAEMAKMLVVFITHILKGGSDAVAGGSNNTDEQQGIFQRIPSTPLSERGKCNTFTDLNQVNAELQAYIIKACELGLMGLQADGQTVKSAFKPNDTITLAEVATTISRLLRGETYKGSEQWRYHNHLLALQKAGIIPPEVDPMRKEVRGNILVLLMKSSLFLSQ